MTFSNTATGSYALLRNTSGGSNTATGSSALYNNTTGLRNTASGDSSLLLNTTGGNNTGLGVYAGVTANSANAILENRNTLSASSRSRLTKKAAESALWAVSRTDMSLVALSHLATIGEMASDPRTGEWVEQPKQLDPYWFRPHAFAARLLVRQGKIEEALKEAAIEHELAPYEETSSSLWRQLVAATRNAHASPELGGRSRHGS